MLFTSSRGFTLVELSIVLVILGLLVGGVLAGQSLIRAAELRAVTTEHGRIITAVNAFKDKYFALPGDMNNAVSYWGQSANCPGTSTQGTTDGTTCNGDGNGRVDYTGNIGGPPTTVEFFRFWQHLASAGLIEGQFNGVSASNSYGAVANKTNSPQSKMSGAIWFVHGYTSSGWNPIYLPGDQGNRLHFSGASTSSYPSASALTPPEAYNLDMKMDDGNPIQGKLLGQASPDCTGVTNGTTATGAAYVLTSNTKACFIYFPRAF